MSAPDIDAESERIAAALRIARSEEAQEAFFFDDVSEFIERSGTQGLYALDRTFAGGGFPSSARYNLPYLVARMEESLDRVARETYLAKCMTSDDRSLRLGAKDAIDFLEVCGSDDPAEAAPSDEIAARWRSVAATLASENEQERERMRKERAAIEAALDSVNQKLARISEDGRTLTERMLANAAARPPGASPPRRTDGLHEEPADLRAAPKRDQRKLAAIEDMVDNGSDQYTQREEYGEVMSAERVWAIVKCDAIHCSEDFMSHDEDCPAARRHGETDPPS